MVSRRNILKVGLFGIAGFNVIPKANAQSSGYGIVGQQAPELNLDTWIDKNGNPTSFQLIDHVSKWVFLKCFQSWCPGCHSHGLPAVKKISEALADNPNIVFAGIQTVFEGYDVNSIDKVRKTQLQYNLQFPMAHDVGENNSPSKTMMNYRTGGTPWMIIINPKGTVVFNDFSINVDKAIEFLKEETALLTK